jgi:hypothetical protein
MTEEVKQPTLEELQAQLVEATKRAEEAQTAAQKLQENNKALLAEKLEAKRLAEEAALAAAKKSGDVEALEKSWAEKLNQTVAAKDQELNSLRTMFDGVTRGATAATISAEIFGEQAELMRHHVDIRLRTEIIDGKPTVRVLDAAGNLTALTVDDLKNEFRNNSKFAPFVVASKASGGAPVGQGGGGAGATMTRSQFDGLGPAQKAKFMKDSGRVIDG